MAVSRAMRRLLQVLEIQEEECRAAMESARAELQTAGTGADPEPGTRARRPAAGCSQRRNRRDHGPDRRDRGGVVSPNASPWHWRRALRNRSRP